jgi:hypothetical protein
MLAPYSGRLYVLAVDGSGEYIRAVGRPMSNPRVSYMTRNWLPMGSRRKLSISFSVAKASFSKAMFS